MKKLLSILLAILILFSLSSCFVKEEKTENVQTQTDQKENIDTQIEQNEQVNTQVEQNDQENVQNEEKEQKTENKSGTSSVAEHTYEVVEPTEVELDELENRIGSVIAMMPEYNYRTDNPIRFLIDEGYHPKDYSSYENELCEYISEPSFISEYGIPFRYEYIYKKDPKNIFGELSRSVLDKDGNVDEKLVWAGNGLFEDDLIGHIKINGEYFDWLIEGMFNGTVDHEATLGLYMENTDFYWYDGNYYTPYVPGAMGGPVGEIEIIHITKTWGPYSPLYAVEYAMYYDDSGIPFYYGIATVGLKERDDGFRFWSVFSNKTYEARTNLAENSADENEIDIIANICAELAENRWQNITFNYYFPEVRYNQFGVLPTDEERAAEYVRTIEATTMAGRITIIIPVIYTPEHPYGKMTRVVYAPENLDSFKENKIVDAYDLALWRSMAQ